MIQQETNLMPNEELQRQIDELKLRLNELETKLRIKPPIPFEEDLHQLGEFEDIKQYEQLKVDRLNAGLPVFTTVPTYTGWEGEIVIVNDGTDQTMYSYLSGAWEQLVLAGGVTYTFYEHEIAQAANKGIPQTITVDRAATIDKVYIHLETAPGSGKTLTVDVNKGGTTIFTTQGNRPSIADTSTTDESGTPDVTSLAKNDELTMDVDLHNGASAKLSVYVRCT